MAGNYADELCSKFASANIVTTPTVGPDRHTAFIELYPRVILEAYSYESADAAAKELLERLRVIRDGLVEGLK